MGRMEHRFTDDKSVSGVGQEMQIRRRLVWTIFLAALLSIAVLYLEGRVTDPFGGRPAAFALRTLAFLALVYGLLSLLNVGLIAFQGSRLSDQVFAFVGGAMAAGGLMLFERRVLDVAVHVDGLSVEVAPAQLPLPELAGSAALVFLGSVLAWRG